MPVLDKMVSFFYRLSCRCSCCALILLVACGPTKQDPGPGTTPEDTKTSPVESTSPVTAQQIQALLDEQDRLDDTVFRHETQAQEHEQTFVNLWDRMRAGKPWEVLEKFYFEELQLGLLSGWESMGLGMPGMEQASVGKDKRTLRHEDFVKELKRLAGAGWQIVQSEWHHSTFRPRRRDRMAQSVVSFEVHVENSATKQRVMVKGELGVEWTTLQTWDKTPYPGKIWVREALLSRHTGPPVFAPWMHIDPRKVAPRNYPRVSPLLVYDLNKDGLPEVVLAGCNLLFWNEGKGRFRQAPLLKDVIMPLQEAAILADFTGDGRVDFVSSGQEEQKLRIWPGGVDGGFEAPSSICFDPKLAHPHVLSAGDVDGDGDLDLFLGQWRQPYEKGSMPTPYYDAHDGHPDFLLLNDGTGVFSDVTETAGLAAKRNHRTFSASLADLDTDGDLDLLTVADFSGIDFFRNDGSGKFEDVTESWVGERHGFGMSHVLDDFDGDGLEDVYMVGMSSTTARRLDRLGIRRDGFEKHDEMREAMTFGNRMYLRRDGKLEEPTFRDDLARTGWSWGCATGDFDNDGDRDLYVANGHLSGKSARDYCTRFWCHDVYTGNSSPNPVLHEFYSAILGEGGWQIGNNVSWNGYEHNHLFLNDGGRGFRNVAFLTGSALEFDARSVVATDLDANGRVDLLVVRYDTQTYGFQLHVLRNQSGTPGNWIGVRLQDQAGRSVLGAQVTIKAGERSWVRQVVTGDSFTAQHPSILHFGLGGTMQVDFLEVRWPDGEVQRMAKPETGQYHLVTVQD